MSDVLLALAKTISERKGGDPTASYTASLLAKGRSKCAEKFGEEAIEAIIAAAENDPAALKTEAADVLYHLLVLLAAVDVPLAEVLDTLKAREQQSGLAEKASRPR